MQQVNYFLGTVSILTAIAASTPSTATHVSPLAQSIQVAQANTNCRQVITENTLPFYLILPANREEQRAIARNLAPREQVGLANGATTVRGGDGELYLRVYFPYNRANPDYGYVPARFQNRSGTLTSTLGQCSNPKRMW